MKIRKLGSVEFVSVPERPCPWCTAVAMKSLAPPEGYQDDYLVENDGGECRKVTRWQTAAGHHLACEPITRKAALELIKGQPS